MPNHIAREAEADRGAGVALIYGHNFNPKVTTLANCNLQVEVAAGGGSVDLEVLGNLGWVTEATGLSDGEMHVVTRPAIALRATWTGGSGGNIHVVAGERFNGPVQ